MSVRSRLAAASWPVQLVFLAGLYALLMWPLLLLDPRPAMVSGMIFGPVAAVAGRVLDGGERRRLSGWDRPHRVQVTEQARRGVLPGTDADRAALRRLVDYDLRQQRGFIWLTPLMIAVLVAAAVLPADDASPVRIAVAAAWFVLVGAALTHLHVRDRAERRVIAARLDAAGVAPDEERRGDPTHRLKDLFD